MTFLSCPRIIDEYCAGAGYTVSAPVEERAAMEIDVKDIEQHLGSKKRVSQRESIMLGEIDQKAEVYVDVQLTNAKTRLILTGTLKTAVELNCSRCAENFQEHMNIKLHEEFLPEGSPELEPRQDLNLKDLSMFVIKDDKIDMEEIIRQNILSALPMQPMCSSSCHGLCPVCGENRNKKECGCHVEKVDPRLAALQKFKNKG